VKQVQRLSYNQACRAKLFEENIMEREVLIERIRSLPPEKLVQVEALVESLEQKTEGKSLDARQTRREAVAAFAAQYGGTELDLDENFERAGIEHWLDREGAEQ
jgi:hypothetical protein